MNAPERRLFHCVERHADADAATIKRKTIAQSSWDCLYSEHGVIPCHLWESDYPRTAHDIGDPRALPYLKDVLENGMNQAGDEDILMFCNDDNWLHQELADLLKFHCSVYDVCTSQRCEIRNQPMPSPNDSPELIAKNSGKHLGRDLFAATKAWLLKHWDEIPDAILGSSEWDMHIAALVRLEKGIKTTKANISETMWPCELHRGYVLHQWHVPAWTKPNYMNHAAAQKHNRALFRAFADKNLPELRFTPENTI